MTDPSRRSRVPPPFPAFAYLHTPANADRTATIVEDDIGSNALEACVRQRVSRWTFADDTNVEGVYVPYVFSSE